MRDDEDRALYGDDEPVSYTLVWCVGIMTAGAVAIAAVICNAVAGCS